MADVCSRTTSMTQSLLPNNEQEPIVIAEKIVNRKMMHGMLMSGGIIPVSELFGVRIQLTNGDFIGLQVITKGIDHALKYSRPPRPKKIIIKADKPKEQTEVKQFEHKEESLFG